MARTFVWILFIILILLFLERKTNLILQGNKSKENHSKARTRRVIPNLILVHRTPHFRHDSVIHLLAKFLENVGTLQLSVGVGLIIATKMPKLRKNSLLSLSHMLMIQNGTQIQKPHLIWQILKVISLPWLPYNGDNTVQTANGYTLYISHIGDIKFGKLHLKNTLLVPLITKNLISISKLTNDMDCHCDFSSSEFLVKDRKMGKILGKGSRRDGPYMFDHLFDPGDINLNSSSIALVASL